MNERRKVFELFDKYSEWTESRVNGGIEMYRKGIAEINVTDSEGKPIKGARVKVKQKSHEFKYGANLFMLDELETPEKNELYKKYFSELCNMATLPFYWDATEPERGKTRYEKNSEKLYRRPPIDLCMEFCEKHGIEPREHGLAYAVFLPKWLKEASIFETKKELEKRYAQIAERYANKIPTIEVTNEMFDTNSKNDFYCSEDYVEFCFKLAEKYFPGNELVINEWTWEAWNTPVSFYDRYYAYIKNAIQKGARIDAVGMQYHQFFSREEEYTKTRVSYNPLELYKHMDVYATFGKKLQVTEVTIPAYSDSAEDEEIQAQLIEKLYPIWFSHPNMEQIIYWNLVDGYAAFAPKGDMTSGENYYYGGLLRFDMTPKPAYYVIKDLFEKKWHTEKDIVTAEDGSAVFNGFYGKYDVEIEVNGKKLEKEIDLRKDGKRVFDIKAED